MPAELTHDEIRRYVAEAEAWWDMRGRHLAQKTKIALPNDKRDPENELDHSGIVHGRPWHELRRDERLFICQKYVAELKALRSRLGSDQAIRETPRTKLQDMH